MREHETSAPSLRELSEAATPGEWRMRKYFISAPSTNPAIPGEDVVFSAAYSDRSHKEDNRNLAFAARLVSDYRADRLIDPTTMAEAVASSRAEGVKEGLERAAKIADDWLVVFGSREMQHVSARDWACDAVRDIAEAIRETLTDPHTSAPPTLIPGGSSDV